MADPEIGVSFSTKQTDALGLDWRATYRALLDDMGIRHFRLMSYWDIVEPKPGQYDFSQLDEQIEMARRRGADVSLAIGLRQPRWPECHQPEWAGKLDDASWQDALLDYLQTTVRRYEQDPTVISWQLENEYYNERFADCRQSTASRLQTEFALVRTNSSKPIWMTVSDRHGWALTLPPADRHGLSVYRRVYSTGFYTGYVTVPTPIWYERLQAKAIDAATGRPAFIAELQLEPWPPTTIPQASRAEQDRSMSLQQIRANLRFAREIGVHDIYLWGGEWWYWRELRGDPSVWDTVKAEIR
jgi:hypothetical protein